ncbi:hypothetical protein HCH_02908 [Hahella chejuensis KCTC 2396]|uniref:Uncharacterized protein n=1 Tax=Hahella chejuensis (strain KCTC 2396) TaxID=349521 RepID=Q2SI42_HAHCH|nr:hypothetical protein [Hahella chejuensis]ABC29682.1 hypothetical protein HCH_02908 [Hahella chejuensis KCTC 2396]
MAITLKAYADSGLTTELLKLSVNQKVDGSTGPVDTVIYIGSVEVSKKFEAASSPGVDQIVLSIADANPGDGHEATEVKLALSSGGLDSATAGASLNLGTQLLSGVANALPVHVRVQDATATLGVSTELSLATNNLQELSV